jgi:hypothetical protein
MRYVLAWMHRGLVVEHHSRQSLIAETHPLKGLKTMMQVFTCNYPARSVRWHSNYCVVKDCFWPISNPFEKTILTITVVGLRPKPVIGYQFLEKQDYI